VTAGEIAQAVSAGILFVLASVCLAALHDDRDEEKGGGDK
jgi:hypothetical protein